MGQVCQYVDLRFPCQASLNQRSFANHNSANKIADYRPYCQVPQVYPHVMNKKKTWPVSDSSTSLHGLHFSSLLDLLYAPIIFPTPAARSEDNFTSWMTWI
jgi:hypothetical protein